MFVGKGLTGRCYAFPTKDKNIKTLPINKIKSEVLDLFYCIQGNPDKIFLITKLGCGLAGYTVEEIAPLFKGFKDLPNAVFPEEFEKYF